MGWVARWHDSPPILFTLRVTYDLLPFQNQGAAPTTVNGHAQRDRRKTKRPKNSKPQVDLDDEGGGSQTGDEPSTDNQSVS